MFHKILDLQTLSTNLNCYANRKLRKPYKSMYINCSIIIACLNKYFPRMILVCRITFIVSVLIQYSIIKSGCLSYSILGSRVYFKFLELLSLVGELGVMWPPPGFNFRRIHYSKCSPGHCPTTTCNHRSVWSLSQSLSEIKM